MSSKYPGGIISKTAPTPSGPYADSTAPGVWTLEQQAYWQKLGQWPTAGNVNPNAFIENLFSTYLYTGTGANRTITNGIDLSGKGGLTWIKQRSAVRNHLLFDTVRGATKRIFSDLTNAESVATNQLTAFNADGFSLGNDSGVNINAGTYASWTFRKQPKFFDIVTWTGNGAATQTISHNLGSAPGCIIAKVTSTTDSWFVYHRAASATPLASYLRLNLTNAAGTSGSDLWGSTSTTITVDAGLNLTTNGATYVAYLFAHDAGGFGLSGTDNVVSCGSFSASMGSLVSLGYEPQWVLIKRRDSVDDWLLFDNMRGLTMVDDSLLNPNTSGAENNSPGNNYINPQPTGFTQIGFGSGTYIYIAIRRGPMAVPTLGTSVFTPILTGSGATLSDSYSAIGFPIDMTLRYQTGTNTDGAFKNAVYTRLMGINSGATDTPTSANNPNLLTHSTAAEIATYYYSQTGSMGLDYGGSWSAPAYVLTHLHFKRAPSFFDVVCYTGTGASTTYAHNLGVIPQMIIYKPRITDAGTGGQWATLTSNNSGVYYFQLLNSNLANLGSDTAANFGLTASTFNPAPTGWNTSNVTYVAYMFATCPGVSKVGGYTGTGTTQTINCGFTGGARFVLIKRTDSTGDWYVWDSARGIIAGNDPYLLLNSTAAEVTGTDYVDTTSVGFDITSTAPAAINANGGTFIFLAIA